MMGADRLVCSASSDTRVTFESWLQVISSMRVEILGSGVNRKTMVELRSGEMDPRNGTVVSGAKRNRFKRSGFGRLCQAL
jgi:hypothetical protein